MCNTGLKKRQLVVCGDSFSYGNDSNHWPTIVANKLKLELINLSIVGCSNIAISHQINYCLKHYKPELLIVSLSAADRFEVDQAPEKLPVSLEDFCYSIDEINHNKFNKRLKAYSLIKY